MVPSSGELTSKTLTLGRRRSPRECGHGSFPESLRRFLLERRASPMLGAPETRAVQRWRRCEGRVRCHLHRSPGETGFASILSPYDDRVTQPSPYRRSDKLPQPSHGPLLEQRSMGGETGGILPSCTTQVLRNCGDCGLITAHLERSPRAGSQASRTRLNRPLGRTRMSHNEDVPDALSVKAVCHRTISTQLSCTVVIQRRLSSSHYRAHSSDIW
jgi:hypothetical protein